MKSRPGKSAEVINGNSAAEDQFVPQDGTSKVTKDLREALRGVIENDADEKAKIGCLEEAVKGALDLSDPEFLENSPDLFKILLDIGKAVWLVERKSLAGYSPDLGSEKINAEFISFIRSFQNVGLRRFLMACGKFKLGEKLTYKMIDAAQKEMSESYTLSMIVNFRYGDYLRTCSPFYFDIKSCGEASEKTGRKVTVMRLLRRKKQGKAGTLLAEQKTNVRIHERRRISR